MVCQRRTWLFRHFTQDDGLPSGVIFALAQDADGFLWIGTAAGLARYGGRDFVTVGADVFGGGVEHLATSLSGHIAVVERGRRELWLGRDGEFERLIGPDGKPQRPVRWVQFDAGDTLWVIYQDDGLVRRSPTGDWLASDVRQPDFALEQLRFFRAFLQRNGSLLLATREPEGRSSLWRWQGGRPPLKLANMSGLVTIATRTAGGQTWFAGIGDGFARVYRLRGGRLDTLATRNIRPTGIAIRGDFAYYADPMALQILKENGRAERIPTLHAQSGGPLLVDREGSLWLGTATGLVQYPEPETSTWGADHGLTGSHAEVIGVSPSGVWLSAWRGLGLLEPSGDGWRGRNVQEEHPVAGRTRLWSTVTASSGSRGISKIGPWWSRPCRPVRFSTMLPRQSQSTAIPLMMVPCSSSRATRCIERFRAAASRSWVPYHPSCRSGDL